jgi:alpha-L-rhamnosidase
LKLSRSLKSNMKSKFILIIIFSLSVVSLGRSLSDIRPVDLRVEYLRNPLAVDSPHPRFSWTFEPTAPGLKNLSQKAYQILVSISVQNIESGVGDLWDSKKVLSDRNTHIKYNGLPLKSGQRAYWTARVWDQKDVPSDISTALIFFWDNGFKIDDWSAEWIGAPPGTQQKALQNISDIDSKVNSF